MKMKLLAAVLVMGLAVATQATTYSWPAEWQGDGVQPDGVWSYKGCSWDNNSPASFTAMSWNGSHWYYGDDSWWYHVNDGYTDNYGNAYSIIAWTAPEAGTASVAVSGTVAGWGNCNAILQIMDSKGNLLVDTAHSDGGFSDSASNIAVNAGDSIYIRTRTTVGSQYKYVVYDPLTVTLVPEPATMALLGLGLLGLVRRRIAKD